MVFTKVIVDMVLDEVILVDLEQKSKELQQLDHNFGVTLATECLDVIYVVLEYGRLLTMVMSVEFGNVVDLDVVRDARGE